MTDQAPTEQSVLSHGSLQLEDENGIVVCARRIGQGAVRIYNCVGGRDLTREQAKRLRDWLDDGDTAVATHENDRLRRELSIVRDDVRRLLASLSDAWWIEAAAAYKKLAEWSTRS